MLVLQGPGMQHGQTEISVDDVRCHQWLTNQITEAPLHWRHEPTSIHQSLTPRCGKPPVYSCRQSRGSMFLYLRAEQTLSVIGTVLILRLLQFHALCREFITEQEVQSCVEHPVGSSSIRTLLTAKVDRLLYSFNWYTIYEDC